MCWDSQERISSKNTDSAEKTDLCFWSTMFKALCPVLQVLYEGTGHFVHCSALHCLIPLSLPASIILPSEEATFQVSVYSSGTGLYVAFVVFPPVLPRFGGHGISRFVNDMFSMIVWNVWLCILMFVYSIEFPNWHCNVYCRIYPAARLARKGVLTLNPYLNAVGIDLFGSCIVKNPIVSDNRHCPTDKDMYVCMYNTNETGINAYTRPTRVHLKLHTAFRMHSTDLYSNVRYTSFRTVVSLFFFQQRVGQEWQHSAYAHHWGC